MPKKKIHDFKIDIPLFKSGILFILSDKEYFQDQVQIMFPDYTMNNLRSGKCLYERGGGYNPVVWINNCYNNTEFIGILAHELTHAIYWILEDRGIKHNDETEEVYCYMIQYCIEQILLKIKNK